MSLYLSVHVTGFVQRISSELLNQTGYGDASSVTRVSCKQVEKGLLSSRSCKQKRVAIFKVKVTVMADILRNDVLFYSF